VLLSNVNQTQRERLSHIDFRVCFLGDINRSDLVARFGIKPAAATRDLATYRELAPDNLDYDTKAKTYRYSACFKPLFDYAPNQVLAVLSQGFDGGGGGQLQPMLACESPARLNKPLLPVLAELTRAIHQGGVVCINYHSIENGPSQREIVPYVLVDNGLRWHVRAYCRKREAFVDFVLTRIARAKITDSQPQPRERVEADKQWTRKIELELVPHPKRPYPDTIALDYAMANGMLKLTLRAAVAGYVLRKWNVDCTEDHRLEGNEYHLWLKNRQALLDVDNLLLAPGVM